MSPCSPRQASGSSCSFRRDCRGAPLRCRQSRRTDDPAPGFPTAPDPGHHRGYGTIPRPSLSTGSPGHQDWNSFDIGQGFTVNFTGPTNDAVLNRVVTGDVSNINGSLMSDPSIEVFLINPNGIIFGPTREWMSARSLRARWTSTTMTSWQVARRILLLKLQTTLFDFAPDADGEVNTGVTVEDGASRHDRFGSADPIGRVRSPRARVAGRGHGMLDSSPAITSRFRFIQAAGSVSLSANRRLRQTRSPSMALSPAATSRPYR